MRIPAQANREGGVIMGIDINTTYNQFLAGAASVKGSPYAAGSKETAAGRKNTQSPASFGDSVKAEFSGEGLLALAKSKEVKAQGGVAQANEARLSDKAKEYLNKLREKYGDYDFMVGDEKDDLDDLMSGATKEFSVVLSNEELEKMAEDEDYADEKMNGVEKAIQAAKKLAEEVGFGEEDENGILTGTFFNRFGISVGEDGKISIFADLERITAKQRADAEEAKDARREEQKEAAKEAEEKAAEEEAEEKKINREDYAVQQTRIEASSAEELLEKFHAIDWSAIAEV